MAIPLKLYLHPSNDQVVRITGLKDGRTLVYQNSATVTMTLRDQHLQPVAGCVNLTMVYQAGTNGVYDGEIDDAGFNPPVGTGYTLLVTATVGSTVARLTIPVEIIARAQ